MMKIRWESPEITVFASVQLGVTPAPIFSWLRNWKACLEVPRVCTCSSRSLGWQGCWQSGAERDSC